MVTFYLKYRPKKISDLDLVDVREELEKILASGRMPHAFLFAGPRGAGKTSTARILAKAVNCEKLEYGENKKKGFSLEPCNECEQCKMIDVGNNLDVVEIDAASHRGVDDMKNLREGVKLSPVSARKKVYIIDEAHMLTTEAGNALLKTLEEPPEHVLFILATTESDKILETIRSRCTFLRFRKARKEEIVEQLKKAVAGEKLSIEDGVLEIIAENVDGSFREAHKILEQASFSGKITKDSLKNILIGVSGAEKLVSFLAERKVREALDEVSIVVSGGVNLKNYTGSVVHILHNIFLSEFGLLEKQKLDSRAFGSMGGLIRAIELLSQAYSKIPAAVVSELPLEMAIIEFCSEGKREIGDSKEIETQKKEHAVPEKADRTFTQKAKVQTENVDLEKFWKDFMVLVRTKNHSIEALLRAARPESFDGSMLTLEVFYSFHKERIQSEQFRKIIEETAAEILKTPVTILCVLSSSAKKAVDLVDVGEGGVEEDIVKLAERIFVSDKKSKLPN